jgi:hypothetical protein
MNHSETPQSPVQHARLVNLARPLTPVCGRLRMLMGWRVRRALGLHNDVDLFPSVATNLPPSSERKLIARLLVSRDDTDATALAPVGIHLYAHDEVEHKGKGEAGCHEGIVDLLCSGE